MNLADIKATAKTDPFLALDRLRSEFQDSSGLLGLGLGGLTGLRGAYGAWD